jgi:pimeloyl-ACP methyl ester carboxylesterase
MTSTSTLYLHGGPGLNAGVERAWFDDSLPVLWWDQPLVGNAAAPLDALVLACEAQVEAMAAQSGAPVRLLAWSFGGQLAASLAHRIPSLVDSIVLLGCIPDLALGFVRLGTRLAAEHPGDEALHSALAQARQAGRNTEASMALVAACGPYLPAAWFGPDSSAAATRFQSLASALQFDGTTFSAVLVDHLGMQPRKTPARFDGPVTFVAGRHDRFLAPDEDAALWRRTFPQLSARTMDCGHAVQFEAAPALWWRA